MSNLQQKKDLAQKVVADRKRNYYSASQVYLAYNLIFEKAERTQTCASCLIRRAKLVEQWYLVNKDADEAPITEETPSNLNVIDESKSDETIAEGLKLDSGSEEGGVTNEALDKLLDDAMKNAGDDPMDGFLQTYEATNKQGEAVQIVFDAKTETAHNGADASDLKAGTYQLDNGDKITITVQGRAIYKPAE